MTGQVFVFCCALRQWCRGNIVPIATLPQRDSRNSVQHLQPRCLEDRDSSLSTGGQVPSTNKEEGPLLKHGHFSTLWTLHRPRGKTSQTPLTQGNIAEAHFSVLKVGGVVAQEETKINCHQCWVTPAGRMSEEVNLSLCTRGQIPHSRKRKKKAKLKHHDFSIRDTAAAQVTPLKSSNCVSPSRNFKTSHLFLYFNHTISQRKQQIRPLLPPHFLVVIRFTCCRRSTTIARFLLAWNLSPPCQSKKLVLIECESYATAAAAAIVVAAARLSPHPQLCWFLRPRYNFHSPHFKKRE